MTEHITIGDLEKQKAIWLKNGFPCGANNELGDGYPQLRPMNINENAGLSFEQIKYVTPNKDVSQFELQDNDVIFNNTNSKSLVGKTALWSEQDFLQNVVLSNHMTIVRVLNSNKLNPQYIAYYFHLLWKTKHFKQIRQQHVGQASISLPKLRKTTIPDIPYIEQSTIARVLKAVQRAKETREMELALERERKAALMAYLFTHGTRSEPRKQTEIGKIPESWDVKTLKGICDIKSGGTPSRKNSVFWNGSIPWVKTGEVNFNRIEEVGEHITKEGLDNSSARMINEGTILLAMYGQGITRGRVAILGIDASINQACAALTNLDPRYTYFLYYFLEKSYQRLRNLGHGGNQKNLSATILKSFTVPVPEEDEAYDIGSALQSQDKKVNALRKEIALLDELFHSMLDELMSGKLSVQPLLDTQTPIPHEEAA